MKDIIDFLKWVIPILGTAITWYINENQKRNLHKWELKKKACLEALEIIDACYSNQKWESSDQVVECEKQEKPKIKDVRNTYNNLCLSCDNAEVLEFYKKCLGIYGNSNASDIMNLRNAIREELRYGSKIETDSEKAWIARVNPSNQQ